MIEINIAKDFSNTPGGRHEKEGPFSGEQFREEILLPKYLEAKESKTGLLINLDGCYGYATSFIEEAFGGLARKLKRKDILDIIKFISQDEPGLVDLIREYVADAQIED